MQTEVNVDFLLKDLNHLIGLLSRGNMNSIYINGKLKTFEQMCAVLRLKKKADQSLFEIIWTHALKSELLAPGSVVRFFQALSKRLKLDDQANDILKNSIGEQPTKNDVFDHIEKNIKDLKLRSLITNAIELAGLHSKISIEKSNSSYFSVELLSGCSFTINTSLTQPKKMTLPRVVVIEGYVENVSEMNRLFMELVEKKERCLIFARGFSNDLINTVAVNNNRSVFDITLMVVPFELEGINTLNDIAVLAGAQMISSNLGNLISSTSLADAGSVDTCVVSAEGVSMTASATRSAVHNHIADLLTRAEAAEAEDIKNILHDRVKCLLSNSVIIRIPDNMEFSRNSAILDKELRSLKSIISHGLFENQPLVWCCADFIASDCAELIKSVGCVIAQAS